MCGRNEDTIFRKSCPRIQVLPSECNWKRCLLNVIKPYLSALTGDPTNVTILNLQTTQHKGPLLSTYFIWDQEMDK